MNNTLIVNLKRNGDILTLGHMINSINSSSNERVSLLIFEEFKAAARLLKNVYKIYTIDRKSFLSLKKNALFHDIYALENLFLNLEDPRNQRWDQIINTSNDRISSYVCSFLGFSNQSIIQGTYFDKNNSTSFSGKWARVLNDVIPSYRYTPVNQVDCLHYLIEQLREIDGQKINSSPQHNATAFENINRIRENESKMGNKIKIVGIQLKSSSKDKDISFNTIIQLIDMMVNNPAYFPILLVAPTDEEREFGNRVNKYFNNSLVSVESDFRALPSVLLNIDLLVTPDTVVKHLADLLDTPLVEVSIGWAPFLKQGTLNPNSIILTEKPSTRTFRQFEYETTDSSITGSDIYNAIRCVFEPRLDEILTFSSHVSIYRPKEDKLGVYYQNVGGEKDNRFDLSLHVSRYVLFKIVIPGYKDEVFLDRIANNYKYFIKEWLNTEKGVLLETAKTLLSAIRYLTTQTSENNIQDFTYCLDSLLEQCDQDHLISLSLILFRSHIENISSSNSEESLQKVEASLYDLKKSIQKVSLAIREIEDRVEEIRKNDLVMGRDKKLISESRL